MTRLSVGVLSVGGVVVLGAAIVAASAQADRPGIVLQPKVLVENRGRSEAIPVAVQAWDAGPMSVQVVGATTVDARRVPQAWSYRTVRVASGQDMATTLASAGGEGWEATGSQTTDSAGVVLLLKRPR